MAGSGQIDQKGAVAQLGERLPCTQEVRSSILLGSTTFQEVATGKPETSDFDGAVTRSFVSGFFVGSSGSPRRMFFNNVDESLRHSRYERFVKLLCLLVNRWIAGFCSLEWFGLLWVIWSSDQAYTVDALAARGDEGRGSLR